MCGTDTLVCATACRDDHFQICGLRIEPNVAQTLLSVPLRAGLMYRVLFRPIPRDTLWVFTSDGIHYRRNLPHIVRYDRPLFITFSTVDRRILPPGARTITLRHVVFEHKRRAWIDVVVVMPDHAHLVLTLTAYEESTTVELGDVMKSIKGVSSRNINKLLGRKGNIWQDESFDHVLRMNERSRAKLEYVCNNPVRAGLVKNADDYPWLWRSWIEGRVKD
jgi:REP-associated tyrosine transposase